MLIEKKYDKNKKNEFFQIHEYIKKFKSDGVHHKPSHKRSSKDSVIYNKIE